MNQLRKQITNLIKEVDRENMKTTEGEIVAFNNETMLCDIKILHPFSSGMLRLNNVPMQLGSGGLSQAGPFIGDKCMVSFINGNLHNPYILSLLDTNHENNFRKIREKHERKGCYTPDNICKRDDWEYKDPLYEEVINTGFLKDL